MQAWAFPYNGKSIEKRPKIGRFDDWTFPKGGTGTGLRVLLNVRNTAGARCLSERAVCYKLGKLIFKLYERRVGTDNNFYGGVREKQNEPDVISFQTYLQESYNPS